VQKAREAYKNVANLHVTGSSVCGRVVEFPSQTAHLSKPYKNTGRNGICCLSREICELCVAADKAGLIIHVHAIGDGAVKAALDGLRRREKRMALRAAAYDHA